MSADTRGLQLYAWALKLYGDLELYYVYLYLSNSAPLNLLGFGNSVEPLTSLNLAFCVAAQGAHLMHIQELVAYPYVLAMFHEPLVAVPCRIE